MARAAEQRFVSFVDVQDLVDLSGAATPGEVFADESGVVLFGGPFAGAFGGAKCGVGEVVALEHIGTVSECGVDQHLLWCEWRARFVGKFAGVEAAVEADGETGGFSDGIEPGAIDEFYEELFVVGEREGGYEQAARFERLRGSKREASTATGPRDWGKPIAEQLQRQHVRDPLL